MPPAMRTIEYAVGLASSTAERPAAAAVDHSTQSGEGARDAHPSKLASAVKSLPKHQRLPGPWEHGQEPRGHQKQGQMRGHLGVPSVVNMLCDTPACPHEHVERRRSL